MGSLPPIYLDHLATTPVDPRVFEAMGPYFLEHFGNAASPNHSFGRRAKEAVETARGQVAGLLGAVPQELVFTSGATEAVNLALKGVADMYAPKGKHLVTSSIEHKAVLDCHAFLETLGFEVTYVEPDGEGRVDPGTIASALRPDTILASVMWANNEVGTLNPIEEIGALCRERNVLFFSDASQAAGKVPIDVRRAGVSLLCVSAHKLYGPKGVGALYVSRKDPRVRLAAQLHGGGHERGLRSGTANVPGIVGLGAACAVAAEELEEEQQRLGALRDHLEERLRNEIPDVLRNGPTSERLAGCTNLSFGGIDAEDVLTRLGDDVAVSSGAACTSASLEPSHVLAGMGVPPQRIAGSIRFGLGRRTTREEIDRAVELVASAVGAHRSAKLDSGARA